MIQHLHDLEVATSEGSLIELVFRHSDPKHLTPLNYNYLAQAAATRPALMEQVLFETTICGVPLDFQTYIRVLLSLYYANSNADGEVTGTSHMSEVEKKNLVNLLYLVFKNDCGEADFDFGCELIFEYINAQNNPDHQLDTDKKKRKRRHQKEHHSSESDLYGTPWKEEPNKYVE